MASAVNRPVDLKLKEADVNRKLQIYGIISAFQAGKVPSVSIIVGHILGVESRANTRFAERSNRRRLEQLHCVQRFVQAVTKIVDRRQGSDKRCSRYCYTGKEFAAEQERRQLVAGLHLANTAVRSNNCQYPERPSRQGDRQTTWRQGIAGTANTRNSDHYQWPVSQAL